MARIIGLDWDEETAFEIENKGKLNYRRHFPELRAHLHQAGALDRSLRGMF
jgi:hypothetical protein